MEHLNGILRNKKILSVPKDAGSNTYLQTKFRIQIKPVSSVKHETRAVRVCVCMTSLLVIVFNTKLGKKRKLCVEDGVQSVCVYIYFSNASISDTRICFFLHRNAQFNRDRKKVR